MGRPKGAREVSLKKIARIIVLSLESNLSRQQIAEKVDVGMHTVWRYKKMFLEQ